MFFIAPSSACQGRLPGTQQLRLDGHRAGCPRIVLLLQQFFGKDDFRTPLGVGQQPRLGCLDHEPLTAGHFELRTGLGWVQSHEHIAALDLIAVLDQDGLDHSGPEILYRLAVTRHHHLTTGRYALIERRQRSPQQKPPKPMASTQPTKSGSTSMIDIDARYLRCLLVADITDLADVAVGCLLPLKNVDRHAPSSQIRRRQSAPLEG
ncbi:MAG: hypothetical protein V5B35_17435 [Candidatus Accumulibacter necessarius]|jgi:hypothetical protein